MPKKTIIIFITTFLIVGLIIFSIYLWLNKKQTTTTTPTPWYQNFNPFGTGNIINDAVETITEVLAPATVNVSTPSRFYQITDFAIAGATFLEDTRPIIIKPGEEVISEPVKTIISVDTKEGKKEIQTFLNTTLSLNPPLVVDGVFGKKVTEAIKSFQKLNNLPTTGIVDIATAPFFTKTTTASVIGKPTVEQAPSVRFVERMNGHIYKMFLDTKIKEKISNSTIPSIYEAFFNKTAQTVIYRYLSTDNMINSFIATLGAPNGEFLPPNITDLGVSPDKTRFFYIIENDNGVTGTLGTFGNNKKDLIFNHPFTEWLSSWDNNNNIYLTTKSSYGVDGTIFKLNPLNKTISKIFGGVKGLTTMISPQGNYVLYSFTTDTGPKLGVFNIKEHSTKDLDTYGLAEKCVWSSDNINIYCAVPNTIVGNQYPDYWYQGLITFNDFFVKINTTTGDKMTIVNSVDETPIDGTYLFLDKSETSLFFTNKKDSTLWSLDIM